MTRQILFPAHADADNAPVVPVSGSGLNETGRARHALARIVAATRAADAPRDEVPIVSHRGLGILPRCHLTGIEITQDEGRPHPKGGCWFKARRNLSAAPTEWSAI